MKKNAVLLTQKVAQSQILKTGVTYLIIRNTFGSGITPLLNADGKPIISNVEEIKKDS